MSVLSFLSFGFACAAVQPVGAGGYTANERSFIASFVSHYESNITGKFTHEYHPYLLEKTAKSLNKLEQELQQNGFDMDGRIMLMGYEEQGVPRYSSDYKDAYFTDEMAAKTAAGWSLKMFNRFGLLTGFLFKDINALSRYHKEKYGYELPVTHINPELVEIFDGRGTLFQEHAFGDAYQPVLDYQDRIESLFAKTARPKMCQALIDFWQHLYSKELKITGKQHVVGTQDILFSIAYMRHLKESKLPIHHFYMGPDMTYPIEESSIHNRAVTHHAQQFVKKFIPTLQPRDGKRTAYVFCSFVDGVGKSTMLGNVQNWMQHGSSIEKYTHVDNSSSQLATVFQFAQDVFIADLPAQISHFTYKPDGHVYVDIAATMMSTDEQNELVAYVAKNKGALITTFAEKCNEVVHDCAQGQVYPIARYEQEDPEKSFIATLALLRKMQTNVWVSFTYKDQYYLFNAQDSAQIRLRVPLGLAPSHGLKNICPEQMIFSLGVRFPLAYEHFTADLIRQLKEQGVEKIVMVDFLSMYSRSSRENIRVNYLIQQLALLYDDFVISNSFYQDFVNNAQLLSVLDRTVKRKQFAHALEQETKLRTALYSFLTTQCGNNDLKGVDLAYLTDCLRNKLGEFSLADAAYVRDLVAKKLKAEHESLQEAYGSSREFVAVQQFCADDLVAFSRKLIRVFAKKVKNESINRLWEPFVTKKWLQVAHMFLSPYGDDLFASLSDGAQVRIIARFLPEATDHGMLLPILRNVRAQWYALLSNLLYSQADSNKDRLAITERYPVPPLVALYDDEGMICLVTPVLNEVTEEQEEVPDYSYFDVNAKETADGWGLWEDKLYLTDWRQVHQSFNGVYAFTHQKTREGSKDKDSSLAGVYMPLATTCVEEYQAEYGADQIVTPERLLEKLANKQSRVQVLWQERMRDVQKNGFYSDEVALPKKQTAEASEQLPPAYALTQEQRPGARLFVRMIATLEMIVKDFEADIAARRGNKDDFQALVRLTERITLPFCYGLVSIDPLFTRYEKVKPILKWDYFEDDSGLDPDPRYSLIT